jgi:hypothetical protein
MGKTCPVVRNGLVLTRDVTSSEPTGTAEWDSVLVSEFGA